MLKLDCDKTDSHAAVRYARMATLLSFAAFVLIPFLYLAVQNNHDVAHFDPALNLITLVGIAGSASSFGLLLIWLALRAKVGKGSLLSPVWICASLNSWLIFTFIYWAFFLLLTSTGSDGDGILRGLMILIYPVSVVLFLLRISRQSRASIKS